MTLIDAPPTEAPLTNALNAPARPPGAAIFELDLGERGIAVDLTVSDWPEQVDNALTGLQPLLTSSDDPHSDEPHSDEPHSDKPHSDEAHSDEPHSDEAPPDKPHFEEPHVDGPGVDETDVDRTGTGIARIRAFVDARAAELVHNGAVSLFLLPTGSLVAPVAVGAVFVDAIPAGADQWSAALVADGWTMERANAASVPGAPDSNGSIVRCSRRLPIPGIAGFVLAEHLVMVDADFGVISVVVQGASAQIGHDLSDSVIKDTLDSAIFRKG